MDVGGSPLWSADPAPDAVKLLYDASNDAPSTAFLSAQGWWSRGNANEAWATWTLENISRLAGSTQKDPGDVDNEYETRWVSENWTNYPGIAGLSALFRLLNPKLGPTTGLDGGATKTRATFGVVSVPCDGTLPAS
jgi:hypothetical protein